MTSAVGRATARHVDETPDAHHVRRYMVAILAVAIWMAVGWLAGLEPNAYLLLGVPLTAAFQLGTGRPLRALWVRDAHRFHLGRMELAFAVALVAAPAYGFVVALSAARPDPSLVAWLACAIAGAPAAGIAIGALRPPTLRALLGCLATAGAIGVALVIAAWAARGPGATPRLGVGVWWLLLYLPVTFVLEEVFFRGSLDAYVHRPGERHGWISAAFVSALWALWHLPILPNPGVAAAASLLVVHMAVGVPLSVYWRRSGNLAVPAVAHAVIDAVRNALLG